MSNTDIAILFWIFAIGTGFKKGWSWMNANDKAKEVGKAAADKAIRKWFS
jgi:hypothetical protein